MSPLLTTLGAAERTYAEQREIDLDLLRALDAARASLPFVPHKTRDQVALWIVAPCLAAFALWMRRVAPPQTLALYAGVMREGAFLARLMHALFAAPTCELWTNRNVALRAAFAAGDDEALVNWLVRTRLHRLSPHEATSTLDPEAPPDASVAPIETPEAATRLIQEWARAGRLGRIRRNAQQLSARLLRHWDKTAGEAPRVHLIDFACAGNIQRALRTVLGSAGRETPLLGLNFAMTKGAVWAEEKGCRFQGFLSDKGEPKSFAAAYARTPELIELFVAAPCGALRDYDENGDPVLDPDVISPAHKEWLAFIQPRILDAAVFYARRLPQDLTADLARCVWGRFLENPSRDEAEDLGDWPLDKGIDGQPGRVLAPRDAAQETRDDRRRVAWPAGARVRR